MERNNVITFKDNPLTLDGPELKVGDTAPDFTVCDGALRPVKLSDFKGQTIILSITPSLDTPTCALQTKRFNQEASALNAKVLTISMDLPFAQSRFCESFSIKNILVFSDYKDRDFGNKCGLLIKELALLSRAVLIVDKNGKIAYFQLVKEITGEPDYKPVIEAAKKAGA